METGKLTADNLTNLLQRYQGAKRPEVILAGKLGEDCSYIEMGDQTLVLSTDPVTAAKSDLGTIAFNINMNDIATSGSEGIGLLVTILVPPETEYSVLETIMAELDEACVHHHLQILGGHTEVTDSVTRPIVSVTAVGRVPKGEEIYSAGLRPGDTLVVSKFLGIEGTLILADLEETLAAEVLTEDERREVDAFRGMLSVIPEGQVGKELRVHSMHDVTEGGILGAVYEVVTASGRGCLINRDDLPFHPATLKLTKALGLDETRLISSGAMLFGTDDPETLVEELASRGIDSAIIGHVTREQELILLDEDTLESIEPVAKDEIYRVFER